MVRTALPIARPDLVVEVEAASRCPSRIAAAIANGPKSTRQIALELDQPLAVILEILGDRADAETDPKIGPTAFPERYEDLDAHPEDDDL